MIIVIRMTGCRPASLVGLVPGGEAQSFSVGPVCLPW